MTAGAFMPEQAIEHRYPGHVAAGQAPSNVWSDEQACDHRFGFMIASLRSLYCFRCFSSNQ
jgi:hypothetical protein